MHMAGSEMFALDYNVLIISVGEAVDTSTNKKRLIQMKKTLTNNSSILNIFIPDLIKMCNDFVIHGICIPHATWTHTYTSHYLVIFKTIILFKITFPELTYIPEHNRYPLSC